MPFTFVLAMVAVYTGAKLGKAVDLSTIFQHILGHAPRTFRQFAEASRGARS